MKKRDRVFMALGITFSICAVLAYIFVEKFEDGYFVVTKTRYIDVVGELKLAYTRTTRDCQPVKVISSTEILSALALTGAKRINEAKPKPRKGWEQDGWILTELDFDEDLEPVIVLMKNVSNVYEVAAHYGGTAAPFNDVQVIHTYFSLKRADAPRQLINCYEPAGAPFDRAGRADAQ